MDPGATNDDESGASDEDVKQTKAESSQKFMGVESDREKEPALTTDGRSSPAYECTVCLQTANFPVQLPCMHIFCFLCVKGVAQRSHRCALCRQEIPADFLNDPKVVLHGDLKDNAGTIFDEGYQWFYEGRNGWWQYDDRTSLELEARYKKGDKVFEQLIAGFLYVIDLENMKQCRKNDQSRRRRMRRDLRNIPDVKGIAGLKFNDNQPLRPSGDGGDSNHSNNNIVTAPSRAVAAASTMQLHRHGNSTVGTSVDDAYLAPPAPNNTPLTPQTPADSPSSSRSGSQQDLSSHLHNLHINENTVSQDIHDAIHVRAEYTESDDEIEAYIDSRMHALESGVREDDVPESLTESDDESRDTCL